MFAECDRKLAEARERRKQRRQKRCEQRSARPTWRIRPSSSRPCGLPSPSPRYSHCWAWCQTPTTPASKAVPVLYTIRRGARQLLQGHQHPYLPLLQERSSRQRLGLVALCPSPVDLRCGSGPVLASEHPHADPGPATNRQQGRGNRSHGLIHLYNPLSVSREVIY